jgi:hypothetical protein
MEVGDGICVAVGLAGVGWQLANAIRMMLNTRIVTDGVFITDTPQSEFRYIITLCDYTVYNQMVLKIHGSVVK